MSLLLLLVPILLARFGWRFIKAAKPKSLFGLIELVANIIIIKGPAGQAAKALNPLIRAFLWLVTVLLLFYGNWWMRLAAVGFIALAVRRRMGRVTAFVDEGKPVTPMEALQNPVIKGRAAESKCVREALIEALTALKYPDIRVVKWNRARLVRLARGKKVLQEYGFEAQIRSGGVSIAKLRNLTGGMFDPENDSLSGAVNEVLEKVGGKGARKAKAVRKDHRFPQFTSSAVIPVEERDGRVISGRAKILLVEHDPFAKTALIPFTPGQQTVQSLDRPVPIGVRQSGQVASATVRERHTFIQGQNGSGKSNFVHSLLTSLAAVRYWWRECSAGCQTDTWGDPVGQLFQPSGGQRHAWRDKSSPAIRNGARVGVQHRTHPGTTTSSRSVKAKALTTLASPNQARRRLAITNGGTGALYLRKGPDASPTAHDYTAKPGQTITLSSNYKGAVTGAWKPGAAGTARVTEVAGSEICQHCGQPNVVVEFGVAIVIISLKGAAEFRDWKSRASIIIDDPHTAAVANVVMSKHARRRNDRYRNCWSHFSPYMPPVAAVEDEIQIFSELPDFVVSQPGLRKSAEAQADAMAGTLVPCMKLTRSAGFVFIITTQYGTADVVASAVSSQAPNQFPLRVQNYDQARVVGKGLVTKTQGPHKIPQDDDHRGVAFGVFVDEKTGTARTEYTRSFYVPDKHIRLTAKATAYLRINLPWLVEGLRTTSLDGEDDVDGVEVGVRPTVTDLTRLGFEPPAPSGIPAPPRGRVNLAEAPGDVQAALTVLHERIHLPEPLTATPTELRALVKSANASLRAPGTSEEQRDIVRAANRSLAYWLDTGLTHEVSRQLVVVPGPEDNEKEGDA